MTLYNSPYEFLNIEIILKYLILATALSYLFYHITYLIKIYSLRIILCQQYKFSHKFMLAITVS